MARLLLCSVIAAILCMSFVVEAISAEPLIGLEDPYGGGKGGGGKGGGSKGGGSHMPHTPHTPKTPKTPHKPKTPHTPKTPKMPHTPKTPKMPHTPKMATGGAKHSHVSSTGAARLYPTPKRIPIPSPVPKPHPASPQPAPVSDSLTNLGYAEPTALRYLYYSYATYCDAGDITAWRCRWCTGNDYTLSHVSTVYDQALDAFGFIGYNQAHNEIVVAYRGTQPTSLTNWISDLSFAKTDLNFAGLSGAHVHSGFYNNYNALASQTQSAVAALRATYPSASVYFTGHSLGGAMATLGTLDAVVNWKIPSSSMNHITFGSPRVGDATFASAFAQYVGSSNHYRLVNDDDLVPHLPMKIMGFHHVSTEVWLHGDDAQVCNSSGEDPSCSDSALGISIYDHIHYFGYLQTC